MRSVPKQQAAYSGDPRSLARIATRAEMHEPATVERCSAAAALAWAWHGRPAARHVRDGIRRHNAAQSLFADLADGELIDSFGEADDAGGDIVSGDLGGDDFGF